MTADTVCSKFQTYAGLLGFHVDFIRLDLQGPRRVMILWRLLDIATGRDQRRMMLSDVYGFAVGCGFEIKKSKECLFDNLLI